VHLLHDRHHFEGVTRPEVMGCKLRTNLSLSLTHTHTLSLSLLHLNVYFLSVQKLQQPFTYSQQFCTYKFLSFINTSIFTWAQSNMALAISVLFHLVYVSQTFG